MARGVSSWLESEESFIPEPDVFLDRLQHARREWSKPRPGPDATGPVRVLGRLTILLRYAPARRRAVLKPRLSAFKKAIAETIRDSREDFQRAVEHLLDYRLSVAEDIAERFVALAIFTVVVNGCRGNAVCGTSRLTSSSRSPGSTSA